jgi:hypothetical protein
MDLTWSLWITNKTQEGLEATCILNHLHDCIMVNLQSAWLSCEGHLVTPTINTTLLEMPHVGYCGNRRASLWKRTSCEFYC